MKKLLVFGIALTFCLSACTYPFDTVPSPYWGWQYVQAKTVDGVPLCDLNNGVNTNGSGTSIVAFWDVADAIGKVQGSVNLGEENEEVVIETTLSHWTVLGYWDGVQCVSYPITKSNDPNVADGVTKVTMHFPGFDVSWYEKMLVMPEYPGVAISGVTLLKANRFSGVLEVERTNPLAAGSYTIVVKAMGGKGGWIDIRNLWSGFSYYAKDCYTAFQLNY